MSRRPDVLVLEDDPRLLEAMADVLREDGLSVRAFAHPTAALAALLARPPRLVVTDEEMPVLLGHELMLRARERLGDRAPRFLLIAASGVPRAVLEGFDGVVYKPFRLDELVAEARRLGVRRTRSGMRVRAASDDSDDATG